MVQIAERASILDQEADKILIIERANHLWDRQAIFDWEMAAISSCNSSIVSDDTSMDEEGDGSGFNSYYTETDPQITLQQRSLAQVSPYPCQPTLLLNPSSARCLMCNRALNAGSGTLCEGYGRFSPTYATGKLQNVQASPDIPAPSIYSASDKDKQLDPSQRRAEVSLHGLVDDTSYQDRQHPSCLGCGNTDMWPGASFCLSCKLNSNPFGAPFDVPHTTSSAGSYFQPLSEPEIQDWGPFAPGYTQLAACSSALSQDTAVSTKSPVNEGDY